MALSFTELYLTSWYKEGTPPAQVYLSHKKPEHIQKFIEVFRQKLNLHVYAFLGRGGASIYGKEFADEIHEDLKHSGTLIILWLTLFILLLQHTMYCNGFIFVAKVIEN